jgi:hypothetical protein
MTYASTWPVVGCCCFQPLCYPQPCRRCASGAGRRASRVGRCVAYRDTITLMQRGCYSDLMLSSPSLAASGPDSCRNVCFFEGSPAFVEQLPGSFHRRVRAVLTLYHTVPGAYGSAFPFATSPSRSSRWASSKRVRPCPSTTRTLRHVPRVLRLLAQMLSIYP